MAWCDVGATFLPLFPFTQQLVDVIEARLRLEDVDAEHAAGILTAVTREIDDLRARVAAGMRARDSGIAVNPADARRAAVAIETLRGNLAAWFTFYDGYDPLFTWWMGLPYRHINTSLQGYVALLRDSVAIAPLDSNVAPIGSAAPAAGPIAASAPPPFSEVPDLDQILALPQDEMTATVARFLGRNDARRPGASAPAAPRDSTFYRNWLTALSTLDFDHLTRNAQVDYLYIKHVATLQLARVGHPLPTDAPRKTDQSGIKGAALGRDGLVRNLEDELIPYSPEQLIGLAEREFAWCDSAMLKASRQMGFGNDWKAALEKTKTMHVAPGRQPAMVRDLIFGAIAFLRSRNLITLPEVAVESQRMSMLTAQQQLINPFFLGGSLIQVAYPTDSMEYDAREQAMRGNSIPWSHATAFHEMVPGHNLSGYYNARYAGYRADLDTDTPFYVEGWAVYWELRMYDAGYDATPEERVGALFWRMFRCARIIFSLKFHMGQWSPQQAIDFLVDRVGHERDNATAEVRRSFLGDYSPLYQAGYLLGALQLRGLHHELVDSKQMTETAFHDEILRQGSMPIALLRLALGHQRLTPDMDIDWQFEGELPAP